MTTMDSQLRTQVVFHLTGRRGEGAPDEAALAGLRPVLFAPYRQLDALRYDFPLILPSTAATGAQSLSSVIDALLREIAPPGVPGEGLRRRVLRVEREIRALVSAGATGRLSELWDRAVESIGPDADDAFRRDVDRARAALAVDGPLLGCDASMPKAFIEHAWAAVQRRKARAARERIDALATRLGDILRADHAHSAAALARPALQASFGTAHRGLFDFDVMSRLLSRGAPRRGLDERRRARIERAIAVLRGQRFFEPALRVVGQAETPVVHSFSFDSAPAALDAFRARLPELVELLKAMRVAELEIDGSYVEDVHDPMLGSFDAQSVTGPDLEFFPDYLVCVHRSDSAQQSGLTEALGAGVPIKLLVQVDDLLEEGAVGAGKFAFGMRGTQLATAAMSFGDLFVLQTAASNMLALSDRIERGLCHPGASLFTVYVPVDDGAVVPAYLRAAAAMQSRAFPAFSYDPGAGDDVASRFNLENNPQPDRDWPVERLDYADADLQSVSEDVAFTFADFAVSEPRCASHYSVAPPEIWRDGMVPAATWLDRPPKDPSGSIPYVLAVDADELLCRLVVDERIMRAALRCRDAWHRLQELGGIRDARTERALAREREAWEQERRRELEAAASLSAAKAPEGDQAAATAPTEPAASDAPPAVEAAPERNPDEPYIETIRCSTCNECTQVNPRMFAYNENKQAYIADLKAGTYKEMVEAAESCQVSVIHPGKPWNPDEPGLEELLERAKPFL
jgi:ferredoxin